MYWIDVSTFFGCGRGSNLKLYIYYTLFLSTELSLRRLIDVSTNTTL